MPFIQRSPQMPLTSSSGGNLSVESTKIGSSGDSPTTNHTIYRLSELTVPAVNSNVAVVMKTSQNLSDPDRIQTKKLTTETNSKTPPQIQRHSIAMPLVQPSDSSLARPHSNSTQISTSLNNQEPIMRVGNGTDNVSPVLDSAIGPSGTPSPHRPIPEINSAILVEQVSRILGRQLAVERERRGLKP